jgi:hypothetical protein
MTMRALQRIPPAVARELGHYVYLYVNPLDGSIFYVGKGKGGRALAHLGDAEKREVARTIRAVEAAGSEVRIEILAHALPSAEVALHVESAVIDALGLANLANLVRGWQGAKFGRAPVGEVVARYTRRRARITEPAILIRINRLYHYGMSDVELYDATRSAWVVGERRERADFAFAVFEGVVREVYRITHWLPGGSTFNTLVRGRRRPNDGRWEFVGVLAPDAIRRRYVNSYVGDLFDQGAQNPISYVNVDSAHGRGRAIERPDSAPRRGRRRSRV